MRHTFLCPNHRLWLYSHPDSAIHKLTDAQDTALYYRERGLHQQALVYLGNAFEIAEIILTTGTKLTTHSVIAFTSCTILLADSYCKLGQNSHSLEIFQMAQKRLQGQYSLHFDEEETQKCILACITSLSKGADIQGLKSPSLQLH